MSFPVIRSDPENEISENFLDGFSRICQLGLKRGSVFVLTWTFRKLNWKGINSKRIVTVCLKYYQNTNSPWQMLDGSLLKWRKRDVSSFSWVMHHESSALSHSLIDFERKMSYTYTRINITQPWVSEKSLGQMTHDSLNMTHIFAFDKTIKGYYTNTNYQERTCWW